MTDLIDVLNSYDVGELAPDLRNHADATQLLKRLLHIFTILAQPSSTVSHRANCTQTDSAPIIWTLQKEGVCKKLLICPMGANSLGEIDFAAYAMPSLSENQTAPFYSALRRFTSASWDPEFLGAVGIHALHLRHHAATVQKDLGAYYTPSVVTRYLTHRTLGTYIITRMDKSLQILTRSEQIAPDNITDWKSIQTWWTNNTPPSSITG